MDIRRKLYFYFYFIVIQEVNHRVGRNQIDVVDIGGGLKVRMKEWRIQVKCCTIVYSYVLWCPEFKEGLTNIKILIFLGSPKSESIIVSLVYTGIAQKGNWVSNPVQVRIFSGFLFRNCKSCVRYCDDLFLIYNQYWYLVRWTQRMILLEFLLRNMRKT